MGSIIDVKASAARGMVLTVDEWSNANVGMLFSPVPSSGKRPKDLAILEVRRILGMVVCHRDRRFREFAATRSI